MFRRGGIVAAAAALAALLILPAGARANLVTNGSFENSVNITPPVGGDAGSDNVGMIDYNTTLTGWSNPNMNATDQTGYNFLFNSATASFAGAVGCSRVQRSGGSLRTRHYQQQWLGSEL